MALFIKNENDIKKIELSQEEAFAAVTLIAMNIDGIHHSMEFRIIGMVLDRMKLFEKYSVESLRSMLEKLQKYINETGVEALYYAAVDILPMELRPTAFAVAVDVIMADDVVVEEEKKLLTELAKSLDIAQDLAQKVIEVMQIRYRGCL